MYDIYLCIPNLGKQGGQKKGYVYINRRIFFPSTTTFCYDIRLSCNCGNFFNALIPPLLYVCWICVPPSPLHSERESIPGGRWEIKKGYMYFFSRTRNYHNTFLLSVFAKVPLLCTILYVHVHTSSSSSSSSLSQNAIHRRRRFGYNIVKLVFTKGPASRA